MTHSLLHPDTEREHPQPNFRTLLVGWSAMGLWWSVPLTWVWWWVVAGCGADWGGDLSAWSPGAADGLGIGGHGVQMSPSRPMRSRLSAPARSCAHARALV